MISTTLSPLVEKLSNFLSAHPDHPVLVALDGRCGSGKTTLAAQLARQFPQSITVHTDDFYLPPASRVANWEQIPCANMDLERLRAQVLTPARAGQADPLPCLLLPGGCLPAGTMLCAPAAGHRGGQLQLPPHPCGLL